MLLLMIVNVGLIKKTGFSDLMNFPLVFVFVFLPTLSRGSVLPAYSIYEDALAYIEKMSTDEMIDKLTEMVDKRLGEKAYKDAALVYNKQGSQASGGEISEPIDEIPMFLTQDIHVCVPTRGRIEHSGTRKGRRELTG